MSPEALVVRAMRALRIFERILERVHRCRRLPRNHRDSSDRHPVCDDHVTAITASARWSGDASHVAGMVPCEDRTTEMTLPTNDDLLNRELTIEELEEIAAGRFSWGGLLGAIVAGGTTGGLGGAAVGGIGAGPGAVGGGLLGGIGYCINSLF
jgi:hypothetical protein